MAHLAYHAVCEQDFDDVEADFDRRIIKQPQVVERGFGQPALLAGIYGSRGTSPILGRPEKAVEVCVKLAEIWEEKA